MQSNEYHLRLELSAGKAEAVLCEKGNDRVLGSAGYEEILRAWGNNPPKSVKLFLRVTGLSATLGLKDQNKELVIAKEVDIKSLSTETAGGFVGCTVGMYAVDENAGEDREISFKEFSYAAL